MAWLVAALGLPTLAAYPLVAYCDREARRGAATVCLRACLALGIGVGLSAGGYFLWLFFAGVPGTSYRVCETAACLVIVVLGWSLGATAGPLGATAGSPRATAGPSGATAGSSSSEEAVLRQAMQRTTVVSAAVAPMQWHRLLTIAFAAALALGVVGAIANYSKSPLGDWDAWTIWNQRARFLFRGGDGWRQAFSPVFAHTDYPLLLPASNARLWSYLGAEPAWSPWLVGTLFTFATVGLLAAAMCRLRSRNQGLLAGLTLLGMVPFVDRGTLQYADVPLAFFLLSAVLLLVLYDASQRPRAGYLLLSGLAVGLAAWTKNEGLVLLAALPLAHGAVAWRQRGIRRAMTEVLVWTAGVGPPLTLVAIQKWCLAGGNEFITGQSGSVLLAKLADPWRYASIAQAFALYALRIARPFAVVLPLCFLLLGPARHPRGDAGGLPTAVSVLCLTLAGYFLVYLATPCELAWHLATSAERLLLHLLPLGVWIVFSCLSTPEEVLADERLRRGHRFHAEIRTAHSLRVNGRTNNQDVHA